jgi:hypothetical protein
MYITDHAKQIALIKEMKQLRKDSKNCVVYYHHPYTNQMWKSFFPKANEERLGPKILRHEPVPASIEDHLWICLTEEAPENAIGLGIEWSVRPELWPSIMKVLESQYSIYDRNQLKLFLEHLNLDEAKNQFPHVSSNGDTNGQYKEAENATDDDIGNLLWRSRKIRMKRFFIFR